MSGHLEEMLREAAALGNLEDVQVLLRKGAAVNAQNEIDGWTCLHWACKRNHAQVVAYLLDSGADKEISTVNGELAAQLTSKKEIRKILGVAECDSQDAYDSDLPTVANCLTNTLSASTYNQESKCDPGILASLEDTNMVMSNVSKNEPSPCLSASQDENLCTSTSLYKESKLPVEKEQEAELFSILSSGVSKCTTLGTQNRSSYSSSTCHNRILFTSTAPPPCASLQGSGSCMGTETSLQPLLFSGAFPYNMQELVLKVRVQSPKENDFIEIELDRQELTYQDLLRVSCCELGVSPEQVEKVRKLPNTVVRKDKDVARLQDFQELELVLVRPISSPFRNATATLSESSCYNTKAAKLMY